MNGHQTIGILAVALCSTQASFYHWNVKRVKRSLISPARAAPFRQPPCRAEACIDLMRCAWINTKDKNCS